MGRQHTILLYLILAGVALLVYLFFETRKKMKENKLLSWLS